MSKTVPDNSHNMKYVLSRSETVPTLIFRLTPVPKRHVIMVLVKDKKVKIPYILYRYIYYN
jgi:hypothetical protein